MKVNSRKVKLLPVVLVHCCHVVLPLATIEMQTIDNGNTVEVERHPSAMVCAFGESDVLGCDCSRCKEPFPSRKVCH